MFDFHNAIVKQKFQFQQVQSHLMTREARSNDARAHVGGCVKEDFYHRYLQFAVIMAANSCWFLCGHT